ncbi:MAG: prenyltransferase/squalene oxidase repeat-containing protein [Candidatus Kariarchaeaceae archaeon]
MRTDFLFLYATFTILALLLTPASAASTKRDAILDYVGSLQVSDSGFQDTSSGSVTVEATADASMIYRFLGESVENKNELIYYIQRCQSENGGFSASPGTTPSLEMTFHAIRAIQALELNQSWINGNIDRWKILNYTLATFNESYEALIFPSSTDLHDFSIVELDALYSLIYISSFLETIPSFNVTYVTLSLVNLQYSNGSYSSFDIATRSIKTLFLINDLYGGYFAFAPSSSEGAIAFINAFKEEDGGYSNTLNGAPTLTSSFHAVSTLKLFTLTYEDPLTSTFILDKQSQNGGFLSGDIPTIKDSWMAISSLFYLGSMGELLAPNIPQTEGFVFVSIINIYAIIALIVIRMNKK